MLIEWAYYFYEENISADLAVWNPAQGVYVSPTGTGTVPSVETSWVSGYNPGQTTCNSDAYTY